MGVATRLFTLLGGRLRLYAAFLCIAAIAFGESAIFMAAVILSDRQHAIIGVVVSSLQAAIALLLVVCTLALALLLTKPHARILLLRRRELTGARLLLPTASRPDTVNDITPLLAASRATPFDLLLDLLACVVLIGRASSARLAFGDADNTTNVVVQIVWLFFTWCFALPQFCYLCVAMDADTFGYLTAGLLRCFGCSSSKPPPSKEAYPKIARPSMPPAAELSSISESSEVEVDMSETSQGVPPPPPPASPPQLSPRASVSRADLAADLPGNITKSASGTERWLQRVASAIEQPRRVRPAHLSPHLRIPYRPALCSRKATRAEQPRGAACRSGGNSGPWLRLWRLKRSAESTPEATTRRERSRGQRKERVRPKPRPRLKAAPEGKEPAP